MFLICLGNSFPLVAATELLRDDSCQMACCKGQPRHSAKSCSGGVRHLKLAQKAVAKDILCGEHELIEKRLSAAIKKNIFVRANPINVPIYDANVENDSHETGGLPYLATKLADNFCQIVMSVGSGSFGAGQQRQQSASERAALVSFAVRPRPPSLSLIKFYQTHSTSARRSLTRQIPARAPPIFFS